MNATTPGRGGRPGLARAPPAIRSTPHQPTTFEQPVRCAEPDREIDMPRKKTTRAGKALVTTAPTALQPMRDAEHRMRGSGDVVPVDAIYNVPRIHARGVGPRSAEADKIAWTDAATRYTCIIRRSPTKGHFCGYVAVPPGHVLYQLSDNLVTGFGIEVHGGITHADEYEASEPEETSVCHVSCEPQRDALPN